MRINLTGAMESEHQALIAHWGRELAKEFLCSETSAVDYVRTTDPAKINFVANWLREQGWDVTAYHVPRDETNDRDWYISIGYVVNPRCNEYVRWKLIS